MHVNAFMLQDGSRSKPRIWRRSDPGPLHLGNPAHDRGGRRLRSATPGFQLQPLESFIWGTRSNPPLPRTCPDHVVVFVAAGEAHLNFPGRGQMIRADSIQFVPAGTAFALVPRCSAEGYVAFVSQNLTTETQPVFPQHVISGCSEQGTTRIIDLMEKARQLQHGSSEAINWRTLMGELSALLISLHPTRRQSRPHTRLGPDRRPLVERFIALASARLKSDHTVAGLAAELATTTVDLERACQQTRGKRAIEIVNDIRLEKAVTMLRDNQMSSAQIARELGYTSLAHFTRMFVNSTGRTPESFREQLF